MLLLVTIVLVVIGAISLVIGFLQSALLPIYISIACSVLAAVVLLIFSRMTAKSQKVVTADAGPAPLDFGRSREERTEREPAFAGTGLAGASSGGDDFAPDTAAVPASRYSPLDDEEEEVDVVDDDFPIERYDSRRVGEILPLLAELDLDELDIVREHEEQGKSRATVLARIDQLIDQLEAEDRQEAATRFDDEPRSDAGFRGDVPEAPDPYATDQVDEFDEGDEVTAPPPPPPTQAVSVAALPDDDDYFPIEDYDDLRASEILPLLPELDDDELEMVRERERSGAGRPSVLARIDELTAPDAAMAPPPPPPPPPEPAPAPVLAEVPAASSTRRAAAKRGSAAKAPAPAPAPAKAPVKKAPAVPAATRPGKSGGATAPVAPVVRVKKAPVKKALPKKAPAKKAVPSAVATPTKAVPVKKASVTKVTAKAAPPAKVAAARAAAATKGGGTASAKAAKATKAARKTTKR